MYTRKMATYYNAGARALNKVWLAKQGKLNLPNNPRNDVIGTAQQVKFAYDDLKMMWTEYERDNGYFTYTFLCDLTVLFLDSLKSNMTAQPDMWREYLDKLLENRRLPAYTRNWLLWKLNEPRKGYWSGRLFPARTYDVFKFRHMR